MNKNDRYFGVIPKGASRYSWLTLLNTWLTWALNGVVFAMVYLIGAPVIEEFNLSPAIWGWVIFGYLGIRVIVDIPLNMLSDRLGSGWKRKYLWFPIMIQYSIIGTLIAFPSISDSLWSFIILLLAVSLGTSASESIGVTATAEWWAKEERGFAVGLHHTGYPIGALVGGFFASFILNHFGPESWRLVYFSALATLPFAIWYWYLSSSKNAEEVYKNIDKRNLTRPVVLETGHKHSWSDFVSVLKIREVVITAVCLFLFQAVYNMFLVTYSQYLIYVKNFAYSEGALLTVVSAITGAFFQFVVPSISDRIGRKWIIVGIAVWQAAILSLLPIASSFFTIALVQLLFGFSLFSAFSTLLATAADTAPNNKTGAVMGFAFAMTWLGAASGSLLSGYVLELFGGFHSATAYHIIFYIMVALCIFAGVLRMFGRETIPRKYDANKNETITSTYETASTFKVEG
ncbi:MFS family permease [Virgibacillus halotolerans]|uniref:MFS transporter n=1 Tax=Virgibacillus halotolerans TaxID=1071053 RepID=UPI0019614C6B|nr:MFS transporter [Virgibacillus halotolerans]MBM7599472.1 MFS family permease [Virgibacillus halotolerans]